MAVTEKTKEKGNLVEGLHFYNLRAQLDKTSKDVERARNFLKIATPTTFILYYIASIALSVISIISSEFDYKIIINGIMLLLSAVELRYNKREVNKEQDRQEKREQKAFNKIKTRTKIALSAIPATVAIYQAFTYSSTQIKFITAAIMIAIVFARVLVEIAKFIVERYVNAIVNAAIMDLEQITNSLPFRTAEKIGEVVSNPAASTVKWFDKIVMNVSGQTEELVEETSILDEIAEDHGDSEEKRAKRRELTKAYKEKLKQEKKDKKKAEKEEKKQETKEAVAQLSAHIKGDFKK